ncbi:MAG TPA: hypothetical protein VFI54_24465 [Solirubrobacteraceae bacterium]|nr:hypothetical protein [Solirubrobacteraceae bacterium]
MTGRSCAAACDDTVIAKGASPEATVTGLAATVKVVGGDGTRDVLLVRTLGGQDTVRASRFDSQVSTLTVDAGTDDDTLTFTGTDAGERIDLSSNGGRLALTRNIGHLSLDVNCVEDVEVNALGGADRVFVHSLLGTDVGSVYIDLARTRAETDLQPDTVTIDGSDHGDIITVEGSGDEASVALALTSVDITHADASLDRLTIRGRGGGDSIAADRLHAEAGLHADAIGLQIDGGDDGDDIISTRQ